MSSVCRSCAGEALMPSTVLTVRRRCSSMSVWRRSSFLGRIQSGCGFGSRNGNPCPPRLACLPTRRRVAHDCRRHSVDPARLAAGCLLNAVVYVPYRQEAPGTVSLLLRSNNPPEGGSHRVPAESPSVPAESPSLPVGSGFSRTLSALTDSVRREVQTIDRDSRFSRSRRSTRR